MYHPIQFKIHCNSIFLIAHRSSKRDVSKLDVHGFVHRDIIVKITNNMQLYRLIYYSKSALHVLGDVCVHRQEHLTVFKVSGSVHPSCCRLVSWMSWNCVPTHPWYCKPDTVNTVKCSWWWAKRLPETCRTCRADKEKYINLYSCILLVALIIIPHELWSSWSISMHLRK